MIPAGAPDDYADALMPLLLRLVDTVRTEGSTASRIVCADIRAMPAPHGVDPMEAAAVLLAAMVPEDRTTGELLAWVPGRSLDPREGHALYRRLCNRGEEIPETVLAAHRVYERQRKRRERAAA